MHARQFIRQTPYLAWVMLYCAVTWGLFGVTLGLVTPNLRAQLHLRYEDMGLLMALWATASVVGSLLGGAAGHRQRVRDSRYRSMSERSMRPRAATSACPSATAGVAGRRASCGAPGWP